MYISPNAQQETFSMYDVIVFQFYSHNLAEQKYFFSSYSLRANIFYNLTMSGGYNPAGYGPTGTLALDLTRNALNLTSIEYKSFE